MTKDKTSAEAVKITVQDSVGILTIDRPKVLNALDAPTLVALADAFDELDHDPAVHAIVLTGSGARAFVAGGDISDLNSRRGLAHYLELGEVLHRTFDRIEASDTPTISAVNGWALGGGVELLLCTDLRIAGETAELGLPEINLGLFPGAGGTQRLLRQIAPCKAREMMFTGTRIGAREALELGLLNKVVADASVLEQAISLAREIAQKSPLVLKLLKRTLRHGANMPPAAALAYEHSMIGLVLDSDDAHEGCGAFLAKRKAAFKGR